MTSSSSSSESPSRSSTTPPPKLSNKKGKQSAKPDLKGKKKATSPDEPRTERDHSNWDYTPPEGAVLIDNKEEDAGRFDWDAVKNDEDVELWLIRIPEAIKPKYLENLPIEIPSSSSHTSCIGTLKRKYMSFDLWALGDDDDSQSPVGGGELKGISCLLPRKKKKGRLYPAPKPIARHLVLSAQSVKPAPVANASTSTFKSPQRPSYPKELLKHRFMPFGSQAKPFVDENSSIDVDGPSAAPADDAVSLPLEPSSTSKQQKTKEEGLESPEIVEVQSKKSKKRKAPDIEIVDTPVSKKTKRRAMK